MDASWRQDRLARERRRLGRRVASFAAQRASRLGASVLPASPSRPFAGAPLLTSPPVSFGLSSGFASSSAWACALRSFCIMRMRSRSWPGSSSSRPAAGAMNAMAGRRPRRGGTRSRRRRRGAAAAQALERGDGGLRPGAAARELRDEGADVDLDDVPLAHLELALLARPAVEVHLRAGRQERGRRLAVEGDDLGAIGAEDLLGHHEVAALAERQRLAGLHLLHAESTSLLRASRHDSLRHLDDLHPAASGALSPVVSNRPPGLLHTLPDALFFIATPAPVAVRGSRLDVIPSSDGACKRLRAAALRSSFGKTDSGESREFRPWVAPPSPELGGTGRAACDPEEVAATAAQKKQSGHGEAPYEPSVARTTLLRGDRARCFCVASASPDDLRRPSGYAGGAVLA